MARLYSIDECKKLIGSLVRMEEIDNRGNNRFFFTKHRTYSLVYVSQTKSSEDSKGHWDYQFFHTLGMSTISEILEGGGMLLLIDYMNRRHCLLRTEDIVWLIRHSSRDKGGKKESVVDIVIQESNGEFYLDPYKKEVTDKRLVIVNQN